jgi:hypothetical protein
MWTVDSRCSQCGNKETCEDRKAILPTLVTLSNTLMAPAHADGPGDGILIMCCNDFTVSGS